MPTTVRLGNPNPMMQVQVVAEDGTIGNPVGVPAKHLEQSITTVVFPDGDRSALDVDFVEHTLSTDNDRILDMIARLLGDEHRQYAVAVHEIEQIVGIHAGGKAAKWVDCPDDPELAAAIGKHFSCMVGEPMALLTTVGKDALAAQHLSTSAQPASFNYMAVSENTTAVSAASTTLPGEITTAGGGLLRVQATYAHTGGTNTATLTKTFTANGSDVLPKVIAKIGVLNAASVGTLGYETMLSATATLTVSGDNVTITETVTFT